jgi:L-cystine uptake protein TcyP (sodium:dicarboxylate symporter family)
MTWREYYKFGILEGAGIGFGIGTLIGSFVFLAFLPVMLPIAAVVGTLVAFHFGLKKTALLARKRKDRTKEFPYTDHFMQEVITNTIKEHEHAKIN